MMGPAIFVVGAAGAIVGLVAAWPIAIAGLVLFTLAAILEGRHEIRQRGRR